MNVSPPKNEMSLTESDIQIAVASSVALGKLLDDSLPGEILIRVHREGDINSEITLRQSGRSDVEDLCHANPMSDSLFTNRFLVISIH